MADWAGKAIEICQRFDAYIIPLIKKNQPYSKLSLDKWGGQGLPPDKLPSKDPEQIKLWANKFTAYGVVPSKKFLVLDVDVKKDQYGKDSLKFLLANGLTLNTFVVESPSGGLHIYLKHPAHYTPSSSVGTNIKFEDSSVQKEWDDMHENLGGTTGLDTRYGWAYVVGPESSFGDQHYKLMRDDDLCDMPSTMKIGFKAKVSASSSKVQLNDLNIPEGSIKDNRNDHARDLTFRLRTRHLPDNLAMSVIRDYVRFYDNSDGEAPTFDIMWDMYERAKDKIEDVLGEMIVHLVYVTSGERVLDTRTHRITPFKEVQTSLSNRMITKIDGDGNMKMVNPATAWIKDVDRRTVSCIKYDIRHPHGEVAEQVTTLFSDTFYNTFEPPITPDFKKLDPTDKGIQIYNSCVQVVENVVSDEYDLILFKKWVGVMLFDPGFRPAWHWHIFSRSRGVGKDTLAGIVSTLYGNTNVSRLGSEAFTDKSNKEFYNTGLAIMSDFTAVPRGKFSSTLSIFKSLTGASSGRLRAMYADGVQAAISVRFLMLSNSYNDFPVDDEDRRLYKCQSKGRRLDQATYTWANSLIDIESVTQESRNRMGIGDISQKDIDSARGLMYKYFYDSDYVDMYGIMDCPFNQIKEDNRESSDVTYIATMKRYIKHELFVFASDIVSEDSIQLMLDHLNVKASLGVVLRDLQDARILSPINRVVINNKLASVRIKAGALIYDEDLLQLRLVGTEVSTKIYAVRNESLWCDVTAKRQSSREYKKIIGCRNIMEGYKEDKTNVVSV